MGGGGRGRAEIDDDSLFVCNWLRSTSSALSPGAQQNEMLRVRLSMCGKGGRKTENTDRICLCVFELMQRGAQQRPC